MPTKTTLRKPLVSPVIMPDDTFMSRAAKRQSSMTHHPKLSPTAAKEIDSNWDQEFLIRFKPFFRKTEINTMKEVDPVRADFLERLRNNKNLQQPTVSNVE
jgi:hypothetical protein